MIIYLDLIIKIIEFIYVPSAVGKTHILIATVKKFLNLNKEVIDLSLIDDNDTFNLGTIDLLDDIEGADHKIQNNCSIFLI